MSKKEELIGLINAYKEFYSGMQARVTNVINSHGYTEIGKQQRIKQITDEYAAEIQQYHDKAIAHIDEGLAELENKWRLNSIGRLADAGYQTGLSNVFKMIEMGSITDVADLKSIIDTYKDDFNAIATINNIISKNGKSMNYLGVIPTDNREEIKKSLGQLRNNIDSTISLQQEINPFSSYRTVRDASPMQGNAANILAGKEISINGLTQFISTQLDDDFALLQ